jgi:two-component SAPR family response regulator
VGEILKNLKVPIIFITAFEEQKNYENALKLQPVRIFTKPIDVDELNRIVERILRKEPKKNDDIIFAV